MSDFIKVSNDRLINTRFVDEIERSSGGYAKLILGNKDEVSTSISFDVLAKKLEDKVIKTQQSFSV